MKRFAVLLTALLLVCTLTSCSFTEALLEDFFKAWEEETTETYTVEEMSITLTGIFTRQDDLAEGYDAAFVSFTTGVMVARLTYGELGYDTDPHLTAYQLAETYTALAGTEHGVEEADGVIFFTDTQTVGTEDFAYFYAFYTSEQAYWVVAMYCPAENYEKNLPDYLRWAQSVTFADEETSTDSAETEDGTAVGLHPEITEGGVTFISLGDGTCKIKGADPSATGKITVPSVSPYGDVVTTVATGAFKGFREIKAVSLPDTVKVIEGSAFHSCASLVSVNLPPEVESFGRAMFTGCGELKSVVLPRGMTELPAMTFQTCVNLESVEYRGDVITSIGASAFNGCRSLWKLSIPGGLKTIGASAFQNSWPVVYYGGSPEEWERVEINPTNNGGIIGANVIFD